MLYILKINKTKTCIFYLNKLWMAMYTSILPNKINNKINKHYISCFFSLIPICNLHYWGSWASTKQTDQYNLQLNQ